ncbi:alpha-2-macroglobulin family protein [Pontibacter sp. BT310]|uniref:Alpha-2-macroglobulin family protein n=1 Tax=Pontibacter populi TaxID=890055 RepID=A0ABS6X9X6_9BACT|nr:MULTISPECIES: alpha-2-macroglobulin [Pontibacter]MBJ6117940.1 alpha-2-macroglobulin family protein [Pontibacter sp. BT310]MBR0570367.1 alpha-2-macroglobulin family protein [Microvirga sp. STS03]MBW3364793.1 alpha-2-macroglobulin family protein [Pontibacter populi]
MKDSPFTPLLSFWFIIIVALVSSCKGKSDELLLESRNFEQEIMREQNLVFKFDKDVMPDSLLNNWDTIPYITFRPAVPGQFKWTAPNELVFSPARPFAPSTNYQAELTNNLLRHSKTNYKIPSGQGFTFHTPYLGLTKPKAYWTLNENNPTELEANLLLTFNYPVTIPTLRDNLHVYQGKTELPLEVVSNNRETIVVKLKNINQATDEAIPVRLTINKGLTMPGSTYQTSQTIEREIELPSRRQMQVTEVATAFEEGQERIYIFTTQPVTNTDLHSLVTISPRRDFSIERLENGLVVKGNFGDQENYTLTISGNLTGVAGKELGRDYRHPVTFQPLQPTIAFVNQKSIYLSSQGSRDIALNLVQVPRIKVSIGKVYENNILRYLQDGKMYDGYYDEEAEEYYENSYYDVNNTNGNTIFEREYNKKELRKKGNAHLLHLDLNDLDFDSQFKGLYVINVSSTDKKWLKTSKIVSVSDIGLIAKQGKNDVVVFANSIRNGNTLEGVEVRFISTNNQILHKATTDKDGVARFSNIDKLAPDFIMGLITARLDQDFNYMPYSQTQVNTSRFDVGGKRLGELAYDAYIYGDRDLYRPGDTVHVNTIVRTPAWETIAGLPIKVKLLLPNGKELRSVKAKLNKEGAAATNFILSTAAVTGTYTIEVYSGNDVLLNSRKIGVEEFMPDRLKVTATLNKTAFVPGEKLTVNLTAQNLFGPPAANRNYEVQLSLKKKYFEAKNYPDYNFEIETSGTVDIQNSVRQGQTDAQGKGQETFELAGYQDVGLLDGSVYTTVFDETGRPVNRLSKFDVSTQQAFYGIRRFDAYVSTRRPMNVPLLALDRNGKPVSTTARVQLVRFTYESVIERYSENYNYKSQRKENIVLNKTITIPAGGGNFNFTPVLSGEYELRLMRPGAYNYVAQEFYAYGWGDTESTSFEVNTEGEVDIALDKESYAVGDKAKVLFKAPFAGKILVTVEQDKVLSHYYLKTDKKAASLELPIVSEHLPTVYITATALRQVKDNRMPLTIARGFKPVTVTAKSTKLDVVLTAPEVSRSNKIQEVKIKTVPNAEVTLAVVDEGILQLKDYKTPDPHGYFYQKRALETESYDLYPFLFPELSSRSSVGGDGYDLEKRINPLTSKRVKLVSLWSGHLKTNSNGEAIVKVKIPEFSGAVRVMAVAYKGSAFGSSEKMMRVSDPVVISTALPRFVSPKDTLLVPVTLSNTTAKKATASSTVSVTGPLRIVGSSAKSTTINPNSEAQVIYKLVATPTIGQAKVTVNVNALGEKFSSNTDITVRPTSPLSKITEAGTIKDGETTEIKLANDFIPSSVSSKLIVSNSPLAQFTDDITFLLRYPHGCLEQTTSTAFPLLYFTDLAKSLQQTGKNRTYNPNYLVQEAITKIELMQQYDGGFTYWPGAENTDWWSSTYATHFLLEAKKAGYPVTQQVLDKALTYLQRKVKGKGMEEYRYYNASRKVKSKYIASRETAYSLYVLSIAGKPDWATMNYYKAKPELVSLDSRYLLASAFALNGRRESFSQILPRSFAGETSLRALDGSFYSPMRDMAISLNSLIEADPENSQVTTLARHLSEELSSSRWYNTQERAFALMALGKLANRSAGNSTVQVIQNGKVIGTYKDKDLVLQDKLKSGTITLKGTGKGTLYYFWEIEGISQSGNYNEEDNFMQVRRAFFDRDGRQITNNTFKQNDLIIVRIALQSLDGRTIPNVAITDMLPAGFEIENPRLMSEREFSWLQKQEPATPDYTDIRDDRINIYATARPKEQYFFYQVRAVSKGNFQLGPVGADAMYNAEYHSYNGAGTINVK